jgi:hypothetical protein
MVCRNLALARAPRGKEERPAGREAAARVAIATPLPNWGQGAGYGAA